MAQNKTIETENSVAEFLKTIGDEQKRQDCSTIIELFTEHSGFEPKMWGTSIVGFGAFHYKYESGHEGDAPLAGLAARSNAITLYLSCHFDEREQLLAQLGKHQTGKACIYIKKLEDIDTGVLGQMVKHTVERTKELYEN